MCWCTMVACRAGVAHLWWSDEVPGVICKARAPRLFQRANAHPCRSVLMRLWRGHIYFVHQVVTYEGTSTWGVEVYNQISTAKDQPGYYMICMSCFCAYNNIRC